MSQSTAARRTSRPPLPLLAGVHPEATTKEPT